MLECTQPPHSCAIQSSSGSDGALVVGDARSSCFPALESQKGLLFFHVWFLPRIRVDIEDFAFARAAVGLGPVCVAAKVGNHCRHANPLPSQFVVSSKRVLVSMTRYCGDVKGFEDGIQRGEWKEGSRKGGLEKGRLEEVGPE